MRDINEKRPKMVLDRLKLEINDMTWRFDSEEDVEFLELPKETSNFILSKVANLDLGESYLCLNRDTALTQSSVLQYVKARETLA